MSNFIETADQSNSIVNLFSSNCFKKLYSLRIAKKINELNAHKISVKFFFIIICVHCHKLSEFK